MGKRVVRERCQRAKAQRSGHVAKATVPEAGLPHHMTVEHAARIGCSLPGRMIVEKRQLKGAGHRTREGVLRQTRVTFGASAIERCAVVSKGLYFELLALSIGEHEPADGI